MLLKDYKEITEIDGQIEFLHSQLSALYELRTTLFGAPEVPKAVSPVKTQPKTQNWTTAQYESLKQAWATKGVQVPAFKTLSAKLKKSESLFALLQDHPEAMGKFSLLLVPPTTVYTPQSFALPQGKDTAVKSWKLFAVYNRLQGIKIEDYTSFAKQKSMKLAGKHMPGLTVREYAAFLDSNSEELFDLNTWSMLPQELRATNEILCVSNINDTYYCMEDDILAPLGENYFRPAMEIK